VLQEIGDRLHLMRSFVRSGKHCDLGVSLPFVDDCSCRTLFESENKSLSGLSFVELILLPSIVPNWS
jgi:hypothetical protein